MIDTLYAAILEKIKDDVTAVKWIDLDSGQLDNPERNYPFAFPAVFIDFPEITWSDLGERRQDGDVQINVRVAMRIINQTHGNTQDTAYDTFTQAMNALKLLNTIHSKLHGFSDGTNFGRLIRLATSTERRDDGLKVFNMIYSCRVMDLSAQKTYTTVPDGSELNVRYGINRSHIRLSASADDLTPLVGGNVDLSIVLENTGIETGTAARVTVALGNGFEYVSNDKGVTFTLGAGTWSAGSVAASATKTLHVIAKVLESGAHAIISTLTYAEQADPASHNIEIITMVPFNPES